VLAAFSMTVAHAQTTPTDEVQELVVTGTRGALKGALDLKRSQDGFLDAIFAEDIAQFPEQNIAEALQRLPGVTINREQGQGSSVILRGFTPEYTRVEVNGLTALSSKTSRGFDFKTLASELFSRAEVYKSSAAHLTEGGTAGVINLVTPKPLDRDGVHYALSADASYAELAEATLPRVAAMFSRNWNDRFGIAASIAYSENSIKQSGYGVGDTWDYLGDSLATAAKAGLTPAQLASWSPRVPMKTHKEEDLDRFGATLDLQFNPTERLSFVASGIYGRAERQGFDLRQDIFGINGGLTKPTNLVFDNGRLVGGTVEGAKPRVYSKTRPRTDEFQQYSLKGDFELTDRTRLSAQVGYVEGRSDEARYEIGYGIEGGRATYTLVGDYIDGTFIPDHDRNGVFENGGRPIDYMDPAQYPLLRFLSDKFFDQKNDELSARVDLQHRFERGPLSGISAGVRYADTLQAFVNEQADYNQTRAPLGTLTAPGVADTLPWSLPGAPASYSDRIFYLDYAALLAALKIDKDVDMPRRRRDTDSYSVGEETWAAYVKANFEHERLSGDVGLRYVDTQIRSRGHRALSGFADGSGWGSTTASVPVAFENSYRKLLPSLNARFAVRDGLLVRASAGRSLTRPELSDLSPIASINLGTNTGSASNPDLEPLLAWNYDLGVEWYFGGEGLFSLTVFRKDLNSLVETMRSSVEVNIPASPDGKTPASVEVVDLARPVNGKDAKVTGVEVSIQSPFDFLPQPLDGFGGIFNYTYADSEANFQDATDVRSFTLPGLSRHSFNAVLYFQNERLDARLAYNWRDHYLLEPFASGGNPLYSQAYGQLDLSVTVNVTERLAVQLKGINLTQDVKKLYTAGRKDLPSGVLLDERTYSVGARYRF
jgi:iron complex outermembrane receptor protein